MKVAYEDELVTLYCGDSQEFMADAMQGGAGKCVIVTDPPYGDTSLTWDRVDVEFPQYAAGLTSDMWCFGSLRFWLENAILFQKSGFKYGQEVVWEKHNGSSFHADRFKRVHELAVQWYRGDWNQLQHNVPVTMDATPRTVRRKRRPPHTGHIEASAYKSEDGGPKLMRSVQYVRSAHGSAIHPTQKPTGILRPLIEYSCPADALVFDPFAGSASTLIAARELGRKAIGVEINPTYCELAAKRLAQTELLVA